MSDSIEIAAREMCRVSCPMVTRGRACEIECGAGGDILRRKVREAKIVIATYRSVSSTSVSAADITHFLSMLLRLYEFEASHRVIRGGGIFTPKEVAAFPDSQVVRVEQWLMSCAQGIEAQRAETEGLGSREPDPAGDAPNPPAHEWEGLGPK